MTVIMWILDSVNLGIAKLQRCCVGIGFNHKDGKGCNMSSDQTLVISCIGDEILPSYIGMILGHYKDPYQPTSISWNVNKVLNLSPAG